MAGVLNTTKRQYNIKAVNSKGSITVVRLKPGVNFVEDDTWKDVKDCEYIKQLKDERKIDFGTAAVKLDQSDKHQKSQTKEVKPRAEIAKSK